MWEHFLKINLLLEFGTNFSTILDDGHPMLPKDPLDAESEWVCEKTGRPRPTWRWVDDSNLVRKKTAREIYSIFIVPPSRLDLSTSNIGYSMSELARIGDYLTYSTRNLWIDFVDHRLSFGRQKRCCQRVIVNFKFVNDNVTVSMKEM